MKYKVLYIKKSGIISWYDVETIQDCVQVCRNEKQEVDIYERKHSDVYVYLCSLNIEDVK